MTPDDRERLRSYAQHIMDHGHLGSYSPLLNPEHILELLAETETRDVLIDRTINMLVGKLQDIIVDHIVEVGAHKLHDTLYYAFEERVRRDLTESLAKMVNVTVDMNVQIEREAKT